MIANRKTILLSTPKEIDVASIEHELAELWKVAAVDGDGDAASPPTKACALNLVFITERDDELDDLGETAGAVTTEHPSRIFLITVHRRIGTPSIDAWISARCSLPVPGGKQVCCEQITIRASGADVSKIPSIVTSLLVSDVPGVLVWKSRVDAQDSLLHSMSHVIDRIIIDSSKDASPEISLLAWRGFIDDNLRQVSFGDLAWTHLTAWRSVVAGAFNPQEMRTRLSEIESVTIHYSTTINPKHTGLSQSLLFAAWMATKLSWSVLNPFAKSSLGRYDAKMRLGEYAINIHIIPTEPRNARPGSIEKIVIGLVGGTNLAFESTEHHRCLKFANGATEKMLAAMNDKSEAELIAEELEVMSRDAAYEKTLDVLAESLRP